VPATQAQLQPSAKQVSQIDALLQAFSDGCDYANQAVKPGLTSKTTIHSFLSALRPAL
jgi:hypothetical protein